MKKRSRKTGLPQGSLIHIRDRLTEETKIDVLGYDEMNIEEKEISPRITQQSRGYISMAFMTHRCSRVRNHLRPASPHLGRHPQFRPTPENRGFLRLHLYHPQKILH
jgi:hypothetical protein